MTIKEYEKYSRKAYFILVRTGRKIPGQLLNPSQHWWRDSIIFFTDDDEKSFSIKEIQGIINNDETIPR